MKELQDHIKIEDKNNSAMIRVLMILSEAIGFGNYFTVRELVDVFGVSETMVLRYFQFIKEHAEFVEMEVSQDGKRVIRLKKHPQEKQREGSER